MSRWVGEMRERKGMSANYIGNSGPALRDYREIVSQVEMAAGNMSRLQAGGDRC